jgi:hypothetical protein
MDLNTGMIQSKVLIIFIMTLLEMLSLPVVYISSMERS